MQLLLDTHVFLWASASPLKLSKAAREAIVDRANQIYVSAALAWEIAIKYQSGKLRLPTSPISYVPSRIASLGGKTLAITQDHAFAAASLPAKHADPFDRIMIAQALVEGLTFVTHDALLWTYQVNMIKA